MAQSPRSDTLQRLSYIEGRLAGIERMLEENCSCADVLKQTYAVRRALEKVEACILEGHLRAHVVEGIKEGYEDRTLEELMDLFDLAAKNKIGGR